MNTAISKSTLEKEQKRFVFICKCAECFFVIMQILFIFLAVTMLIGIILCATGNFLFEVVNSKEYLFSMGLLLITCLGLLIALNFSSKVFRVLKDGESPFRYDVAYKIRCTGIALIAIGLVGVVVEIVSGVLVGADVLIETEFINSIVLTDTLIWGVFILALSYIFLYGCKLQQESDETL